MSACEIHRVRSYEMWMNAVSIAHELKTSGMKTAHIHLGYV